VTDILSLDATAQLHALETRRVGAFELLEACQAALNSKNPRLNAVVAADFERSQERARAIDDRRAKGETLGVLAGLPLTVKDTFDVDGLPASAGQEGLRNRKASDAHCVALARTQGAVVWGKTNTPALERDWQTAGGVYGTANNPWDVARSPGGSSGGGAAAVASGLTALDIGSDSSGGLRLPAAWCGVYAHRPTPGLVDSRGHVPARPGTFAERELRTPGPMARSARDLRLLLSAITAAPVPAKAPAAELKGMRTALWLRDPVLALDPECRTVIEAFVDQLAAQGAEIHPISAPVDPKTLLDLFSSLLFMAEAEDLDPDDYARELALRPAARLLRAAGAGPFSWPARVAGPTATHRARLVADEARARNRHMARSALHDFHVVIAPCVPVAAIAHQREGRAIRSSDGRRLPYAALAHWSALGSVCGLPSTVVPVGVTLAGLPVGVQIIGPRGGDSRTLAVAQALEETLGGFVPPPAPPDV
jgi:amidase